MRISDWSSDVCSSDLLPQDDAVRPHPKRVADKIARRHLARAFQIGGPGFQPHDMALAELQLGRVLDGDEALAVVDRSEEHTSELQSLMRNSYAVFCLKKKQKNKSL